MKIESRDFEKDCFKVTVLHFKLDNPKAVAVVFPGAGYSHMGPCLYYPSNLFLDNGIEVLNFEYDFRKERLKSDSQESYAEYFDFLMWCLGHYDLPKRKIALSKSIGTRILASKDSDIFSEYIWLTPAIKDQFVVESIKGRSSKSFVVIGDADLFYDEKVVNQINAQVLVVEGADHGLDVNGDVQLSLDEMSNILTKIEVFIFGDLL